MSVAKRYSGAAIILCAFLMMLGRAEAQPVAEGGDLERDPQAEAAYAEGIQQLEQENWAEAVAAFSNAIGIDGTDTFARAFVGRGDALRGMGDYPTALESYLQATRIYEAAPPSPEAARAYNGRGICYRETDQIDLAINDFDTAVQMDRESAEIAANYGDLLVQIGDAPRALGYLDQAIELDPNNAEAYRNRGLAHAEIQEFEEATRDLARSVEINPENYETHAALAGIYIVQNMYVPGIDAISQAIVHYEPQQSSDPDTFIQGYLRRAEMQFNLALLEETPPEERDSLFRAVIADTDRVLEEFPDSYPNSGFALHQRGLALRMQERFSEAIKALTDAIQMVPAGRGSRYTANAYLKRGICWHYQGQNSLARGDFEQAAGISFEDPLPHLWIGFTHAQEGNYRDAIESYGEAIAKSPIFPAPYVNRGLAYMQLGDYQKAVDNFNEAIRNEPTEADHFYKRGVAHLRLEEYQKAFDSFVLASLNDEKSAPPLRGAAIALRGLGRDSLASQYESRASDHEADSP